MLKSVISIIYSTFYQNGKRDLEEGESTRREILSFYVCLLNIIFYFSLFIKVYAVQQTVITDFIIRKQAWKRAVLYFDDINRAVVRHTAVPEVVLVFIDIA